MYKIVNIADLNVANVFIESDKAIEITSDKTKMQIAKNDWAHKNQSYLAKCIDIADKSMTSYLKAIDAIKSTYFVTDITNVYLKNGSAIKQETFDTILSSNAFLTKEGCKKLETDCIAYIDELKNKAVSLIMANLNASFITQNSVNKYTYGQKLVQSDGTTLRTDYALSFIGGITQGSEKEGEYDFNTGEFSLPNLLFDATSLESTNSSGETFSLIDSDAWKDNFFNDQFLTNDDSYSSFDEIIEKIDPSAVVLAFNADEENSNYKVNVPENSFDYQRNQTIPVAKLVEYFLKRQIRKCITTVCNRYISNMASIPLPVKS